MGTYNSRSSIGLVFFKSITIIDDTYNSNVESTLAAIDYLKAFSGNGKRIFVFGDMLELGNKEEEFHVNLLNHIIKNRIKDIFTYGSLMNHLYRKG